MDETGLTAPEYSFNTQHTALIIGAGLAGCSVAYALAKRGFQCKIYDQHTSIAKGASAIPAAIVRPSISGDSRYANYFNEALRYCIDTTDNTVFNSVGVLQLVPSTHEQHRKPVNTDTASCSFKPDIQLLDSKQASSLANTELNSAALYFESAGWLNPSALCQQWSDHPNIEFHGQLPVTELRHTEFGWQLLTTQSKIVGESRLVVLASAYATSEMLQRCHLPLQTVRGQIDQYEVQNDTPTIQTVITGDGYLIPGAAKDKPNNEKQMLWVGATHQRNDEDTKIRQEDITANFATAKKLAPKVTLADQPTKSFAGIRTSTPDRLPLTGAMPDIDEYSGAYSDLRHGRRRQSFPPPTYHQGLYINTGFGSRGASQSAFSGELLARLITGENGQSDVLKSTHPARFFLRGLRRGV